MLLMQKNPPVSHWKAQHTLNTVKNLHFHVTQQNCPAVNSSLAPKEGAEEQHRCAD